MIKYKDFYHEKGRFIKLHPIGKSFRKDGAYRRCFQHVSKGRYIKHFEDYSCDGFYFQGHIEQRFKDKNNFEINLVKADII
jgi:hypothetical protein